MVFLHKNIKRFEIDGEIYDEATIPRIKEQYIDLLKVIMHYSPLVHWFMVALICKNS